MIFLGWVGSFFFFFQQSFFARFSLLEFWTFDIMWCYSVGWLFILFWCWQLILWISVVWKKRSMLCKMEYRGYFFKPYMFLISLCHIAETSAWGPIYSWRNRENYRRRPDICLPGLSDVIGCYKSGKALQAISGGFHVLIICTLVAIQVVLFHDWPSDIIRDKLFMRTVVRGQRICLRV